MNFHLSYYALKHQNSWFYKYFIYSWYKYYIKYRKNQRSKRLSTIGPELLDIVFKNLNKAHIDCWLEFGSLLGYCREHDFISHDEDIDIGAFYKDHDKIYKILTDCGLQLKHQFHVKNNPSLGFEQTYIYKGLTIDIFYFHLDTDRTMHCNSFGSFNSDFNSDYIPVKQISVPFSGFQEKDFKDTTIKIPKNWEEHLIAHYGPSFMIPNSNFDYRKEATNIKYYSKEEREGVYTSYK